VKKILFSIFLLYTSVFGQPNNQRPTSLPKLPFESEIISIPRIDGDFSVYFIYKMPYKLMVFERVDETFSANFRVIVEISDENSELVKRDIKDSKISVKDFESTNDHMLFLQEYLSFKLKPNEYKFSAIISDLNSTGELSLKPEKIKLGQDVYKKVLRPFIIHANEINCNNNRAFLLANSGGNIPFSSDIYHLIIPVSDTLIKELSISIENNDENIFSEEVNESYIIPIGVTICENNLAATTDSANISIRNFVLRNVNERLREGKVVLKISNEENEIDEEYESQVIWINKPFSLLDNEKAIEFLSYIESDSVVSLLLDEDESDYPKALNDYWKKFDPTTETAYNEIMFEYYSRVDYALKEFRAISNSNGAKTDRGMIYIKFGNPEKIERISNPEGLIIESWTYLNPERKFSFVDKKGTGNFTLIEE
ncbi:MAG: GWxTD domain-containing protein, partial [Ignavibacteriaceae bacterium]